MTISVPDNAGDTELPAVKEVGKDIKDAHSGVKAIIGGGGCIGKRFGHPEGSLQEPGVGERVPSFSEGQTICAH